MSIESPNSGRSFGEWVRYVWDEGLARHVIIEKAAEGKRPVNLPLTFVLVGGLLAPWLLALGVLVAVLRGYAIRVEGGGQPAPTEPLDEAAADVADEAQSILDETTDETADLAGEAVDSVHDAADKAEEAAESVEDTVEEAVTGLESKIEGEEQR